MYKRLKSQGNPVANSIYAILGGATENQNKVLKENFFTADCLCRCKTLIFIQKAALLSGDCTTSMDT